MNKHSKLQIFFIFIPMLFCAPVNAVVEELIAPPNSPTFTRIKTPIEENEEINSFTLEVTYEEEPVRFLDEFSEACNCIHFCTVKLKTVVGGLLLLENHSWEEIPPVINIKRVLPEKLQLLMAKNPVLHTNGSIKYDNGKLLFPKLNGMSSIKQDFSFHCGT